MKRRTFVGSLLAVPALAVASPFRARRWGGGAGGGGGSIPLLGPGASWNGTAGSGGGAPSTQTRTTAAPSLRLFMPPKQRFSDDLTLFVQSFCKGGLTSVKAYCEGNNVTLTETVQNYTDINGTSRTYVGYWVTLDYSAFTAVVGAGGAATVYFEAIPADGTMQKRVISATFYPKTTLHDADIQVFSGAGSDVAGVTYYGGQTGLQNALNYVTATATVKANPRITIMNAGTYDLAGFSAQQQPTNWITIRGDSALSDGGVVIGKTSWVSQDDNDIRNGLDRIKLTGAKIKLDFLNIFEIYPEPGFDGYWCDGIEITNTYGQYAVVPTGHANNRVFKTHAGADSNHYFTECNIHDMQGSPIGDKRLARGCTIHHVSDDTLNRVRAMTGCTGYNLDSLRYIEGGPALTITYSGSGSGTVARSDVVSSAFTLTLVDDAGSLPITVSTNVGGANNPFTSDVASAINARSGWTATVAASSNWIPTASAGIIAAKYLTKAGQLSDQSNSSGSFTATDAKTTPLVLYHTSDFHQDFAQIRSQSEDPNLENCILSNSKFYNVDGQIIFLTIGEGGAGTLKDWHCVNVAFHENPSGTNVWTSTFGGTTTTGPHSHTMFLHCTMANQDWKLSQPTADQYSVVSNCAISRLYWSTAAETYPVRDHNVHWSGTVPSGSTNSVVSGSMATNLVDAANGDFRPKAAGALTTNLAAPLITYDAAGNLRVASDAPGAYALAA